MKKKILRLLAVGLLAGPIAANALVVTISGHGSADGQWDISTVTGTPSALTNTIQSQVWWGDASLALAFTKQVQDLLLYPNSNGTRGPAFAVCDNTCLFGAAAPYQGYYWVSGANNFSGFGIQPTDSLVFAVASRPVPEPGTLVLLGLGLTGLALSRKRKAT